VRWNSTQAQLLYRKTTDFIIAPNLWLLDISNVSLGHATGVGMSASYARCW